jgi:N-acetylglucosaminyldiphosphoundecaprenol N-acetyl-beta-D-mannosaminyltransferase
VKTVDVIGLPVAVTNYSRAIEWIFEHARKNDRAYGVEAASSHVPTLARHDKNFAAVMEKFSLICPDGMPVLWSVNRGLAKEEKLTDRVYGPNLMLNTIQASEGHEDLKHFFLGGSPSTLKKLQDRFANDNPNASIVGVYSPPFREWSEEDLQEMIDRIKESGANLIWVGLGCPKQETWIAQNLERLPAGCYFGIGAAFAFHAGEVDQAPAALQSGD